MQLGIIASIWIKKNKKNFVENIIFYATIPTITQIGGKDEQTFFFNCLFYANSIPRCC